MGTVAAPAAASTTHPRPPAQSPPAEPEPEVTISPVESAKAAGLRYVSDRAPGIHRKRAGRGFSYTGLDGKPIRDEATLARIKKLAIPPAWTDVWISPWPNGHIQATGRDAKGRKQYRYHARWRQVRDETKYNRMIAFGEALPRIRERVDADLALPGLPREKVLATVVRLLEETLIRVGNEEYARENKHFGLTTLQDQHVAVNGSTLHFHFMGKSGQEHEIDVKDRRVSRIVKRLEELPGRELFQYMDEEGKRQDVDSGDVNAYLHEISGEEFTAKDFRTWAGTVLAAKALEEVGAYDKEAQAKHNIVEAVERVAQRLGNTPTVCRKCYVHPAVVDAYLDGTLLDTLCQRADQTLTNDLEHLSPEEAAVLAFLRERLAREAAAR